MVTGQKWIGALILGWVAGLSGVAGAADDVLEHRSWQFHYCNWEHLQRMIPKAKQAGMNRIQLSHRIIMDAEELWQGEEKEYEWRRSVIRHAIDLAHGQGLKVDMWTHELSGVDSELLNDQGQVVLDETLWQWVRDKYEKTFEILPGLDGLVLTFAETDYKVYSNKVVSDLTPPERTAKLIEVMAEVCARHDKLLIVRTFVYEPTEIGFLHEALSRVAETEAKTHNIIVMTKCVPHDWTPYYPFNPLLGNVDGLPQVVEIDLGQEFTGQSQVLHCEVDYVKQVMDYCREKGVIGGVARVERMNNCALETPNEVNIHAFSRLLHDPGLSVDTLWNEWVTARYGSNAADALTRALRRTYEITNITFFPLEYWITNHSRIPNWGYAYGHIMSRQNYKWIPSPRQVMLRDELLHPNSDTLLKIDHEKDLAEAMSELSLEDLEEVKDALSEEDYAELKHYLELGRDCVEVFRHHQLAMFAALRYMNAKQNGTLRGQALAEAREVAEEHVKELRKWADKMEERYGGGIWPGNPDRARGFANEVSKRLDGVR